jgi:SAM-dependent methyltransferase
MTIWDRLASEYDSHFTRIIDEAEDAALRHLIGPLDGLRVLDVGCGTGHFLDSLNGSRPEFYCGIDPSIPMLDQARRKHRSDVFLKAGAEGIRDLGSPFDLAVSLWSLPYWQDRMLGLKAVRKQVKPGGRFVCMAYTTRYLFRPSHITPGLGQADTVGSLRRSLGHAGFTDIDVLPFRIASDEQVTNLTLGDATTLMIDEALEHDFTEQPMNLIGVARG